MSNSRRNTVLALLTGVAVGAGIVILFAPVKGSKIRNKIKEGYQVARKDFVYKFKNASQELNSRFSSTRNDLKITYEELVTNMSHKTEDLFFFLETKLSDLKAQNMKL